MKNLKKIYFMFLMVFILTQTVACGGVVGAGLGLPSQFATDLDADIVLDNGEVINASDLEGEFDTAFYNVDEISDTSDNSNTIAEMPVESNDINNDLNIDASNTDSVFNETNGLVNGASSDDLIDLKDIQKNGLEGIASGPVSIPPQVPKIDSDPELTECNDEGSILMLDNSPLAREADFENNTTTAYTIITSSQVNLWHNGFRGNAYNNLNDATDLDTDFYTCEMDEFDGLVWTLKTPDTFEDLFDRFFDNRANGNQLDPSRSFQRRNTPKFFRK